MRSFVQRVGFGITTETGPRLANAIGVSGYKPRARRLYPQNVAASVLVSVRLVADGGRGHSVSRSTRCATCRIGDDRTDSLIFEIA